MNRHLTAALLALATGSAQAAGPQCKAQSAATVTPVIDLYTSEGCSSCPPADRWLSTLKPIAANGKAVVQAFHVGYWDYIGWVDRFATPAHMTRQRQIASWNALPNIYTPQLVRNGRDWRDWQAPDKALGSGAPARVAVSMQQADLDSFTAQVTPGPGVPTWSAYWTVTEHDHGSKVKAGENAGEQLRHDFVVRQYVQAGAYWQASALSLRAVPAQTGHARQVNLVVFDPRSGQTLQALSLGC